MIKIDVLKHGDCSKSQIRRICEFKKLNWSYPIESHIKWIEQNLDSNDLHLLLYDDDVLCAYLNLVETSILLETEKLPILGIGNVCVLPESKGKGYGILVMDVAKFLCKKSNRTGVLFCQDKNVSFYEKCHWIPFNGVITGIDHVGQKINTFATQRIYSEIITVNRDF